MGHVQLLLFCERVAVSALSKMRYDVLFERLRFCTAKPLRGNVLEAAARLMVGVVR